MIQAMDHGRSDEWYKRAMGGTKERWMVQTMQLIEDQVRQDKGIINYNLYNVI